MDNSVDFVDFWRHTLLKNDITIKLSTNPTEKGSKQYWIGQYNVDKGGRKYVGI